MRRKKVRSFILAVILIQISLVLPSSFLKVNPAYATYEVPTYNVTASSGYPADVQAAIDDVIANGTDNKGLVLIPQGNFTFNPQVDPGVTIPSSYDGEIWIGGAGMNLTWLRWNAHPPDGGTFFDVYSSGFVRIFNMTIEGLFNGGVAEGDLSSIGINFYVPDLKTLEFRVDHMYFINFTSKAIGVINERVDSHLIGLIDNNIFDNPYKDLVSDWTEWGYGVVLAGGGGAEWVPINTLLGLYNSDQRVNVYIEDNVFSRTRHAIASNTGAWYVARFNVFREPRPWHYGIIDVHGGNPGGRGLESYNNTIYGCEYGWNGTHKVPTGNWYSIGHLIRGGGGVIFNNTLIDLNNGIKLELEGSYPVYDLFIWDNTMEIIDKPSMGSLLYDNGGFTEGTDYYQIAYPSYQSYVYPHPLQALSPAGPAPPSPPDTTPDPEDPPEDNSTSTSGGVPNVVSNSGESEDSWRREDDEEPATGWEWLTGQFEGFAEVTTTGAENIGNAAADLGVDIWEAIEYFFSLEWLWDWW